MSATKTNYNDDLQTEEPALEQRCDCSARADADPCETCKHYGCCSGWAAWVPPTARDIECRVCGQAVCSQCQRPLDAHGT